MIEIYKTNVKTKAQSNRVIQQLNNRFSGATVNFDLQDCDKILRVSGIAACDTVNVVWTVRQLGYFCEILE